MDKAVLREDILVGAGKVRDQIGEVIALEIGTEDKEFISVQQVSRLNEQFGEYEITGYKKNNFGGIEDMNGKFLVMGRDINEVDAILNDIHGCIATEDKPAYMMLKDGTIVPINETYGIEPLKDGAYIICAGQNTGKAMRGDTVERTSFEGMFDQRTYDDDGDEYIRKMLLKEKNMSMQSKRGKRMKKGWQDILCK